MGFEPTASSLRRKRAPNCATTPYKMKFNTNSGSWSSKAGHRKEEFKLKIQYKARNVELSNAMKEYVDKKLKKLDRIVNDDDSEAEVRFSKERERYTVETTLKLRSIIVRAEESTKDFYASVDNAVNNLERRLKRFKDRYRTLKREKVENPEPVAEDKKEKIVKVKRFLLRPMNVDEAMIQLDMLDHEFFMFRNVEDDQINLLYRRKDGYYGLIAPK